MNGRYIRTNISGAEEKLTDAHGLSLCAVVECVLAVGNKGFPTFGFTLLVVPVDRFCLSHKA